MKGKEFQGTRRTTLNPVLFLGLFRNHFLTCRMAGAGFSGILALGFRVWGLGFSVQS